MANYTITRPHNGTNHANYRHSFVTFCGLYIRIGLYSFFPTKGSGSSGDFTIRTGFNFHKSTSANRKPRKPKVPTRDNGVQLSFEGGVISLSDNDNKIGGLGNIVATYKWNPQLSLAWVSEWMLLAFQKKREQSLLTVDMMEMNTIIIMV